MSKTREEILREVAELDKKHKEQESFKQQLSNLMTKDNLDAFKKDYYEVDENIWKRNPDTK